VFQFKNTIMYSLAIILLIVIIDLYRVTQLCIFPKLKGLQMKQSTIAMLVFLVFTLWSLVFTIHGEFLCSLGALIIAFISWFVGITLERESK